MFHKSFRLLRFALSLALGTATLGLTSSFGGQVASAQSAAVAALKPVVQSNRVAAGANLGPQTQLTGHLPAWVKPSNQVATKSADLSSSMHLIITLQRDATVQAAFKQLLDDQQNPNSALYHQWLTPQQLGDLYGPTQSDVNAVTSWLSAQGLTVLSVAPSRMTIHVTGTAAAVANAFRTSFAYYNVRGMEKLSATSEPSIPTALTPVISVVGGLVQIPRMPHSSRQLMQGTVQPASSAQAHPSLTITSGGVNYYFLMPADFATIYDINSIYNAGNTGATIKTSSGSSTQQHIAIVGESRVSSTDISNFASYAGLSSYNLNTIVPPSSAGGVDPGITNDGDQDEATLDVDRVIGTANGATADLIVSSEASGGIDIALDYNVNTQLDPIQTISFGACEIEAGNAAVTQVDQFFSAAAGEGIATFVSSGDSGAAGCETSFANPQTDSVSNPDATTPSINYLCSSSYVTCVGGTEFADTASPATYWSTTNSSTNNSSALSYIPEGAWNEPTTTETSTGYEPASSGGGASLYISKPTWQTGTGVPSDGKRDTPDVSFSASTHDGYFACLDYAQTAGETCAKGYFVYFGGTSAAAPGMAAIAALLNTQIGSTAQGSINTLLYKVYNSNSSVFHDVTASTASVSSCSTATPSMCNNSVPSSSALTGGVAGFAVTTGYDEATGLGSLDVSKFITAAVTAATPTVSTSLALTTVTPNPVAVNQTVTLTATLSPSSTTLGTPTGSISFYYTPSGGSATLINSAVTISNNTATTTYSFPTAGTYSITATYSGDSNYIKSTATAVSLVVNTSPTFSLSPTASTVTGYVSGTSTGNTDTITLSSLYNFAGTVALSCTTSGITGATCSLNPTSVTLSAGGSKSSVLSFTAPVGTSGTMTITVTGTGSGLSNSTTVSVTVIPPTFTVTPASSALSLVSGATTGNTVGIAVASTNGYSGSVALTCAISAVTSTAAGSCTVSPSSVTISPGVNASATMTVTSTVGTSGTMQAIVTGTGTTTGATLSTTANGTVGVTLTGASFTLSTPSTLSFTSGATTGNTATTTVTSTNGFAGAVSFTCAMTDTSGTPGYAPSCAASSVTLTSGSTATSTITFTSVTAHADRSTFSLAGIGGWGVRSGVLLATLLCLIPFRRRRAFRVLMAFGLLAIGLTAVSGCGGGGAIQSVPQSSAGTYTVVVTGTGTDTGAPSGVTASASTTFTVTIN